MRYSEASQGRVFVVRLEDGDIVHEEIEKIAIEKGISAASLVIVGGVDVDSCLIVGPEDGRAEKIVPVEHTLTAVHEVTGTGTIFPNEEGVPILHMHLSCGRGQDVVVGCIRRGVKTWKILEVIITELIGSTASRKRDLSTGFGLLEP